MEHFCYGTGGRYCALKETAYVEEGRQMVFREAKYLKEELQRLGMEVFPSEANYIFFHGPENLFENMCGTGGSDP